MAAITLNVEGMSCGHCQARIEKALMEIEGIERVEVSLEKAQVAVEYDQEKVGLDQIKEAIEDAGYDVV